MKRTRRLVIFASIITISILSASTTLIIDTSKTFNRNEIIASFNISVTGNAGLDVYPGTGTLSDPHRIEDIQIDASSIGSGIYLLGTSDHVIIRNCTIFNSGSISDNSGVKIEQCSNVTITNCSIHNNRYGISLLSSKDIKISGSNISANGIDGIFLQNSNQSMIIGNLIHQNAAHGISITAASGVNEISANSFEANGAHFYWDDTGQGNSWSVGIIGNYWDDFLTRYPDPTSSDSFTWDTPYLISIVLNQRDEYPLVSYIGIHNPIAIDGNAELDAFPEKTGAGNSTNPYVIADLKIGAGPNPNCIYIKNTNKFVVLENITLSGANTPIYDAGIRLDNCTNVNVTSCRSVLNAAGIYVRESRNITVASSNFTRNLHAGLFLNGVSNSSIEFNNASQNAVFGIRIDFDGCQNLTVLNSTFSYNGQYGAFFTNAGLVSLSNNTFLGNNNTGIAFSVVNDINTTSNDILDNEVCGIDLLNTDKCTTNNNTINGSRIGVNLRSSTQNKLANNTLYGCNIVIAGELYQMVGHNISNSNTVGGKPVIYKYSENYLDPGDFSGAGSVIVVNCTNSSMQNLILSPATIGLQLLYSTNVTVANCSFADNQHSGIYSEYSTGCTIRDSQFINSNKSIELRIGSNNNSIMNNTIKDSWAGVFLRNTKWNKFGENKFEGCGFWMEGQASKHEYFYSHTIDTSNQVNHKVLYYYVNRSNLVLADFANAGQIILVNCSYSTIGACDVSNATTGVQVYNSSHNNFVQINSSFNSIHGIYIYISSTDNNISQSVANNNSEYGLYSYYDIDRTTATLCTFSGNQKAGVLYFDAIQCTINGSTIANNRDGIIVSGSAGNTTITSNTVTRNLENGIFVDGLNDHHVIGNNISFNGGVGIRIGSGSSQNKIYLNIVVGNALSEAYSASASNYWDNNTIGNFWGDYSARYPNATRTGNMWNTQYQINGTPGVYDRHPFYRNAIPNASFTILINYDCTLILETISFTFTGAIGDAPYSAQWSFGDGTANSTTLNPVHAYGLRQTYTITLTIRDYNDEISVSWDTIHVLIAFEDNDGDGLTNGDELLTYGTNPLWWDTDMDGMPDGWEIHDSLDALDNADAGRDPDADGLSNYLEYQYHTDPHVWDTDHDGYSDGDEVLWFSDPTNAQDTPLSKWSLILGSIAGAIVLLVVVSTKVKRKQKAKLGTIRKPAGTSPTEELEASATIRGESADLQQRLTEKQTMLSRILSPQTRSEMEAAESQGAGLEVEGMKAKKMKASSGSEEVIERKIDEKTEAELNVQVKVEKCIVCETDLKGTSYVCPFCKTKYCIRCAIMLSERHENCWACKNLLKFD